MKNRNVREKIESFERLTLIPEASSAINSKGRKVYERKDDYFAFLQLENNQIMIEQINQHWNTGKLEYPFGRGINISMSVSNIDQFYIILKQKNVIFFKEFMVNKYQANDTIYEDKEFLIQDPDGYLLRFNN